MPVIKSQFSPAAALSNAHLQTILASKLFKPAAHKTLSERLELPDGDFLDINFSEQCEGDVVAIFHGLAGCVDSPYIQGAFNTLAAKGFSPALMHWRGCSGEPNRLARSYHSGASDDIGWFIDYLSKRFENRKIYALGYSLGGNALLKYLGESGSDSRLAGAMAISPPLVLKVGASKLNSGISRIYQRYLLGRMRRQHELKRHSFPKLELPEASPKLNSLWKFDDALTAPLHGFQDAADYYARCSARQFLPDITTPTHILCAADDPFFTEEIIPHGAELAPQTTLEISAKGGHVGFLQRRHRWLDSHVADTLDAFRQAGN